jgi:hypothetical protein
MASRVSCRAPAGELICESGPCWDADAPYLSKPSAASAVHLEDLFTKLREGIVGWRAPFDRSNHFLDNFALCIVNNCPCFSKSDCLIIRKYISLLSRCEQPRATMPTFSPQGALSASSVCYAQRGDLPAATQGSSETVEHVDIST